MHWITAPRPGPRPKQVRTARTGEPRRLATLSVSAMLAWFALTNFVSLYPLNDLGSQGSPWASTLAGFIPFVLTLLTIWLLPRARSLVAAWAIHAWVWVTLQAWTWWVPYLGGGHRDHWGAYADTWNVLPLLSGRPGPDVQHLVLQVLSVIAAGDLTRLAWATCRPSRAEQRQRSLDILEGAR